MPLPSRWLWCRHHLVSGVPPTCLKCITKYGQISLKCICFNTATVLFMQIKDQRKGPLTKALDSNAVIEASLRVAEDADVEAAERALLALSQRLDSVVKMSAAH